MNASAITWRKTACNLCYINCGIEAGIEPAPPGSPFAEHIVRIRGDRDNPKSQGYLCNKAQGIPRYVHHQDRLRTPLRRRPDGTHEPVSWDEVLPEIAQRLQAVVRQHGGQTLALYGGGGQGNHAGGAYATALLRGLGSRNVFNALSQEKTGDFWVNGHLFGAQTCHTAEDVHDCDLLLVLGANPWLAHGFPNARDRLNEIRKDPTRRMIVVDPRRTETAEAADLHLAVRPGADAFLMGALLARLIARDALDRDFLAGHTTGADDVIAVLSALPVDDWIRASGVAAELVEQAVDLIAAAKSMVVRAELGIQQGLHSTLNSYLEKLLFLLTGNFGRPGTNALHSWLQPLWGNGRGQRHGAADIEVIGGLLPPNQFPEAVLGAHPDRLRAVWVDSSNPANTAADTKRVEEALGALDLLVVVDVAFTETAALADYVLPAASQYEKCEFTFFNFEYPVNFFHVRAPVIAPLPGTLAEPELYARLARLLGLMPPDEALDTLTAAARRGQTDFAVAFSEFAGRHAEAAAVMPLVLYETLGQTLPPGTAAAAPIWPATQRVGRTQAEAVRRALGTPDTPPALLGAQLFDTLVASRSGAAFSHHTEVWSLIEHPDKRIRLAIPSLLEALAALDPADLDARGDYPFVLSAGQRRLQNANQIFRDPGFRQRDPDGSLNIHPSDLAGLGLSSGDWIAVRSRRSELIVRAQADESLRPGHVVLPHGYGQSHPGPDGRRVLCGPRINLLTDSDWSDPIAATPYHKHVPVALRAASEDEASAAQAQSLALRALAGVRSAA